MSTIYNVRGANGAGKSTLVRRVMELYSDKNEMRVASRKRPLGYRCTGKGLASLFVPGAYETPTGGCDNISDVATIFELVKSHADLGMDVLFEGIVAQHSSTRLLELVKRHPVRVIALEITEEECVASVRARRAARGATVEEFDPRNVLKEYRSVNSSCATLQRSGVPVEWLSREAAYQFFCDELRRPTGYAQPVVKEPEDTNNIG